MTFYIIRDLVRMLQAHVASLVQRVTAPIRNGANASHAHLVARPAPRWVVSAASKVGAWTRRGCARPRVAATATRDSTTRTASVRSVIRLARPAPAPRKITAYPARTLYCFKANAACLNAMTRITPWYNPRGRFAFLVCTPARVASPVWTVQRVKMGCSCRAENADRPVRQGKMEEFIVTILNRSMDGIALIEVPLPLLFDFSYYSDRGQCAKCYLSCKTCLGPRRDQCVTCPRGWQLAAGECHPECPEGFFKSNFGCQKCHHYCRTCKGKLINYNSIN